MNHIVNKVLLNIIKLFNFKVCNDYRKLNGITIRDVYPLPRVDDSLAALSEMKWFSSMDMTAGFHQIQMNPEDRVKTFNSNLQHLILKHLLFK